MKVARITKFQKSLLPEFNSLLTQLSPGKVLTAPKLKAILNDKNVYLLGIFDKKKIVGTAALIIIRQIGGAKGVIEDVVVDEAYRGKGLGEKLMRALLQIAKKQRMEKAFLTSRTDRKAAHALYYKLGFVVKETTVFHLKF